MSETKPLPERMTIIEMAMREARRTIHITLVGCCDRDMITLVGGENAHERANSAIDALARTVVEGAAQRIQGEREDRTPDDLAEMVRALLPADEVKP